MSLPVHLQPEPVVHKRFPGHPRYRQGGPCCGARDTCRPKRASVCDSVKRFSPEARSRVHYDGLSCLQTAFLLRIAPGGRRSRSRLRQRAFAARARLQALLRQAERRRHRLRRAGRRDPQRGRADREHRRAVRRGLGPRRREPEEVREGGRSTRTSASCWTRKGRTSTPAPSAFPDFMHATVALACMQRGKHVYVEKPLTRTPWEARLLQEAAVKYKVATQMGNQGFSHECNRVAAEIVWSGAIGDVTEAHISTTPGTHPHRSAATAARRRRAARRWTGSCGWAAPRCARSAPTTCPTTGAASSISAPGRSATGRRTPPARCRRRCNWARR